MLLNNNLHRCGIEVTIIIILYVTRPHQRTRSCRHCTPSKCRRSPAQFHQLHPGSAADSYIHTHPLVSLSLSPVHSPHLLHTRKGTYGLCEAVLIMNNTIYYIQLSYEDSNILYFDWNLNINITDRSCNQQIQCGRNINTNINVIKINVCLLCTLAAAIDLWLKRWMDSHLNDLRSVSPRHSPECLGETDSHLGNCC